MKPTTRYIQLAPKQIWDGLMVSRDTARVQKENKPGNEATPRVRGDWP